MKDELIRQLKELGLFPIEIDQELRNWYAQQGIDPSKIEMHYSPTTPKHAIERYGRIEKNVRKLHEMEVAGKSDSEEYRQIEKTIETDLFEIYHPTVEDVLSKMVDNSQTGFCGINRDVPLNSIDVKKINISKN